jgi:hypothetical protein
MMFRFLVYLVITIGGSMLVWLGVGPAIYLTMAGLMAACVAGLLISRGNDELVWPIYLWLGYAVLTASLIGAFWPILPIALSWGRSNVARAARGEHHATQQGPSVERPESAAK